jgi:hypothetical protein
MIYDIIIVGSGPTGVASALGFVENGIRPLILDVGYEPENAEVMNENLFDYRKNHNSFRLMIGEDYEALHNLIYKKTIFPKLISPYMRFVIRNAEKFSPADENGFMVIQSFAMGGLANAWGASLYRAMDDELRYTPLKSSDLLPYYDRLTEEIGISGDEDDLTPFYGSTKGLLPPLGLSKKCSILYSRYKKKKRWLNDHGVYMGKPRLCVLSKDYDNRPGYRPDGLESWFPHLPYVYTPVYTLQKLIKQDKVIYHKSVLVKFWTRERDYLVVHAEDINSGSMHKFQCKKLVLAGGTINTAKIVLNTKKDFTTKLPIFDNGLAQVPLIFPFFIGRKFETDTMGFESLDIVFDFHDRNLRLKGSILELNFPLRSVFYDMLPFSGRTNLVFIKYFLPAVLVVLLYFPSSIENAGYLRLRDNGTLEVYSQPYKFDKEVIKMVSRVFCKLGALTHPLLIKFAQPGFAIHYAGTLPMVENPVKDYQCNKFGELYKEPNVYVVDGSLFSYIPAKNFSFTLMANAMRIADHISGMLKSNEEGIN